MTAPAVNTEADGFLASTIKDKLQYHRMRPATYRDQHGRKWSTQVNTETLHPCVPLTPVGWDAPHPWLMPHAKYLKVNQELGVLRIDYDQWIIDITDAWREYQQWVMECARKLYNTGALQMIHQKDPDIRRLAGPGPMSPEFVKAMKAHEVDPRFGKWALGLTRPDGSRYPMPPWAADEMHTLQIVETWDGSDVDTSIVASKYADVEDDAHEDAIERAERIAAAERYADTEEDVDPSAAADFQPLRRVSRSRKRTE